MKRAINYVRGTVTLTAQGLFPERLLNLWAQEGVTCWGVEWTDRRTLRLTTYRHKLPQLKRLAQRAGCEIFVEGRRGLPEFLKRFQRRYAFLIGLALSLLAVCFLLGFVLTTAYASIQPIMFVVFALVGLAWAAINVNSLPMVVEMCKGSDIGKFTGYYYTASMAAQVITPILAGTLMRNIDYRVLFPYAAVFAALSFVTMCFVRHGDVKAAAKKGLSAFEDMED